MSRMLIVWGAFVASLVVAGRASAEDDAEKVLADKGLHRSGSMFVLRAEDEVKKASDAADSRLKEYRRASAWEKDSARDESDKKRMAAELTKERAAMKQQMAQVLPELQAQIQALTQQQAALRQEMNGLRYSNNRYARMQANQLSGATNGLSGQINMLRAQGNQITSEYNDMGNRIAQLDPKPGSDVAKAQALEKSTVSPRVRRDAYVEALTALRKLVDETGKTYAVLAEDAQVKGSLEALDRQSPRIKHVLGPSRKFLDTVKSVEEAEAKVASDSLDPPARPEPAPKRKLKTVKRK